MIKRQLRVSTHGIFAIKRDAIRLYSPANTDLIAKSATISLFATSVTGKIQSICINLRE